MNLLQQFVDFLKNQKHKPSVLTVKNYKADIGQFINWFEKEFSLPFNPSKITLQILDQYKISRNLSPSSIERHISSLRKFFQFLKFEEIIFQSPLQKKTTSAQAREDPWKLRNFKNFLYEYKKSNLTIKNYINDIKKFFLWLNEVALTKYAWNVTDRNLLSKINFSVLDEYKQRLITSEFSPRTINRKLSSLRNYINWAKNQGLISENSQCSENQNVKLSDNQTTRPSDSLSIPSVPNYSSFPPIRLMQKSLKGANLLFDNLFIWPLANTLDHIQYLFWKVSGKKIFTKNVIPNSFRDPQGLRKKMLKPIQQTQGLSDDRRQVQHKKVLNIQKGFYAPLKISMRYLPKHKRIWHHLRHVRPNWYKKYHSYSFTHYLHLAILVILASAVGFGMYNEFFAGVQKQEAILGAVSSAPPRILSFQGKLSDSQDNPITQTTTILFSIYNDENSSLAEFLWQETNLVKPDSDGIFSILLGKNNPIPDTLFSQNSKLFLGITVGNSPELSPRQQLATVANASNAETLQGLEPITNTTKVSNVVLALDSSGNLSIAGSKAHTFQATSSNLVLSGSILSLTTVPGSNSRVEIVPDGIGKIDLSKPIQNSTNNNNLSEVAGAVEFDDMVAILATTSAQSAFTINQDSTGALISASTSGAAKFVVDNDGTGTFAGDVIINGGDLTSSNTIFNLLNSTVTTLNIGGAATTINLGLSGGTLNLKANLNVNKDIILSSLTSNGGILYTNSSGKILQESAGSSADCLMGGATPSFSPCPGSGIFNQENGAIHVGNTSMDVLFGATSTSSAKFAFININSGTPTASISGNITLNSAGIIRTTNLQTLTIGGTTTGGIALSPGSSTPSLFAANGGNVGVGTVTPGAKFDVVGGQTQIEVSTQYSQRLCHSGSDGSTTQSVLLGDCSSGGADIAEYYGSKDTAIEAGDVVVAAPGAIGVGPNSKAYVNKSSSSYQGGIIGIVSTNPYDSFGKDFDPNEYSFPVALVGRIPVKISLENGPIKAGDLLTSSSIPGVAMKATKIGPIVGKALEDIDSIDESKVVGFYDPDSKEYRSKINFPDVPTKPNIISIVKIYAFANVSWYDPSSYLANTGDLIINMTGKNSYSLSSPLGQTLTNIGAFFEVVAANIRAGLINASEVATSSLIVTSDSVVIGGQNLKDYIAAVIDELGIRNQESSIISPVVKTNQLFTNIVSPLAQDSNISISLHDSQFIIHNSRDASGSAVATIDNQGNASFSGTLISENLEVNNDANISGILRARNIIAESIQGFIDIASFSAKLSYVPNLQAEQGLFNQGLMVFGGTSLSDLSIVGQLSIGGTMFITENSIETLSTDLSLQSLRLGGLSIMKGLVYIDTEGNLKVKGDVSILGKLAVNIISPLPTSDLVINNASGSGVLFINQKGDITASGSGTFAKLNFSLVAPVQALSSTEVIASSSAGVANIAPYQAEVTIRNALVTNNSLIYITPVGTPSAQSPFLMRQTPNDPALSLPNGSFTIGVESPNKNPIPFNWLIIN